MNKTHIDKEVFIEAIKAFKDLPANTQKTIIYGSIFILGLYVISAHAVPKIVTALKSDKVAIENE